MIPVKENKLSYKKSWSNTTDIENKLSLALNEAMTLNQMAAKELESGEEFCLKARREGLEPITAGCEIYG